MPNVDLAYQHALDRFAAVGFGALTERERDLAALWQVEAEVTNGGFVHYYSGASGDTAFHAPAALARVGAVEKAAIVRTANALFGPDGPPRDRKERLAAVKELSAQALAMLDRGSYSLVLSDIRMAVMNGTEFYLRLAETRPELTRRFVFITGYPGDQNLVMQFAQWNVPVIPKPFTLAKLVEVCGPFLQTASPFPSEKSAAAMPTTDRSSFGGEQRSTS